MSNIDVSQWKEFKIGQIIQFKSSKHVYYASKLNIQKEPASNEWHPYVVRSAFNNGIRGYVKLDEKDLNPANTISFAQDTAQFFFQTQPYYTGNKVKICSLKDNNVTLTISKALFLISCMYKSFESFSYETSYTVPRLKRVQIKLPVDSSGNPDWHYMDEYISKRAALAHKYVSELKSTRNDRKSLKISGWQEYKISQLFSVRPSKYIRENGKAISNRQLLNGGPNPVVVNSSVSNGIGGTTSYEPTEDGNVITYSDTVDGNTIFYQTNPFVGYSHVKVMEPKEKRTPAEMIFLTAVIGRRLSDGNYDYTNKMTTNQVLNTTIKLPALSDGTPDWATMRKRVADLAALSHRNVTSLRLVTGM